MTTTPLSVVLVTGFLGSGKTTLMRRLIMDAHRRGLRVAVVVNEFGTADIDSHILREADAELIASIAGGCACCGGQNELQETLFELGMRRDDRPDLVLMEASGLADPVLLLDVMTSSELLPLVAARCILSVVDSGRYLELATTLAPLLRRQIQLADILLLNKRDIADHLEAVEAKLTELNPRARILPTEQCIFDYGLVWESSLSSAPVVRPSVAADGAAAHAHYHTVVCPLPHTLERSALEEALSDLPPEVWRAKGFVSLRGEAGLQLVQYTGGGSAGGRFQIVPFYLPPSGEPPAPALVFIGASLDYAGLMKRFTGDSRMLAFI